MDATLQTTQRPCRWPTQHSVLSTQYSVRRAGLSAKELGADGRRVARKAVGLPAHSGTPQAPASGLCYQQSLSAFSSKPLCPSRTMRSEHHDPNCMHETTYLKRKAVPSRRFFKKVKSITIQPNPFNSLLYGMIKIPWNLPRPFPAVFSQWHNHCASCHEAPFMMQTFGDTPCDVYFLNSDHFPFSSNSLLVAEFLEPSFKGQTFKWNFLKLKCP